MTDTGHVSRKIVSALLSGIFLLFIVGLPRNAHVNATVAAGPLTRMQTGPVRLAIDADITNGMCGGTIDATATVSSSDFQVAVCLLDSPSPPDGFAFSIRYDDTIVIAPERECSNPCTDSNPDVNDGETTFSDPALSADRGWNCTAGAVKPTGNLKRIPIGGSEPSKPGVGQGNAFSGACLNLGGANTLPGGAPLGVVRFEPLRSGTVLLSLGTESAASTATEAGSGQPLGTCAPDSPFAMSCDGAAVVVQFRGGEGGTPWPLILGFSAAGALLLCALFLTGGIRIWRHRRR